VAVGDAAGYERVDGGGDGDLDGGAVFQCREVEEGLVGDEAGDGELVAVEVVGAVEAAVEVAEGGAGESHSVALEAIGFDVTADRDAH
jgi:hypothetical protein